MGVIQRPKAPYFVRHWRGELSLPVSYWVNCVLLSTVLQIAIASWLVRRAIDLTEWPRLLGIMIVMLWIGILVVSIWQITGAWRSAARHRQRGGSRFWAGAAHVALALAAVGSAVGFVRVGIPHSIEFAKIALQIDFDEPPRLTVIEDGRVLAIEGPITFGLTRQVEAFLADSSDVRTIELSSIGGRVQEARKLARLIAARGLDTRSAYGCASACTIAFMAGAERRISIRAVLGFHRYHFPGIDDREIAALELEDRKYFISRGLPGDFIARIYATPHSEMWEPSHAELLQARVVTAIVMLEGDMTALRQYLADHVLYGTLQEFEPELYATLEQEAVRMLSGGQFGQFAAAVQPLIVATYNKYLPRASDDAVRTAMAIIIEEAMLLRAEDTDYCFLFFNPDPSRPLNLAALLKPEVLGREFEAMAAVIRSGAGGMLPANTEEARFDMMAVNARTSARMGDRLSLAVVPETDTRDRRAAKCDYTVAMMEEIMNLPGNRAPALMRLLVAAGSG